MREREGSSIIRTHHGSAKRPDRTGRANAGPGTPFPRFAKKYGTIRYGAVWYGTVSEFTGRHRETQTVRQTKGNKSVKRWRWGLGLQASRNTQLSSSSFHFYFLTVFYSFPPQRTRVTEVTNRNEEPALLRDMGAHTHTHTHTHTHKHPVLDSLADADQTNQTKASRATFRRRQESFIYKMSDMQEQTGKAITTQSGTIAEWVSIESSQRIVPLVMDGMG